MYLEKKYQNSVTLEHDGKVEGITLVETWIKESREKDKSKLYGLNVPVGSWLGTFKIDNEEMREKFRKGDVSAVSIEGIFEHLEKTPKEQLQSAMLMESFADFMDKDVEELTSVEADMVLSKLREAINNKEHLEETTKLSYIDDISEDEAKDLLNKIHSMLMPNVELAEPSVNSTYPGEASGSISPATI